MNPWFLLGLCAIFAAATGGAYMRGRADGENKIEAQQKRENDIATKAAEAATNAAALAISGIKVQNRTVQNAVEHIVSERTVYRDPACSHDASSLLTINAALTGAKGPEPAGSGVMPGTNTPR